MTTITRINQLGQIVNLINIRSQLSVGDLAKGPATADRLYGVGISRPTPKHRYTTHHFRITTHNTTTRISIIKHQISIDKCFPNNNLK